MQTSAIEAQSPPCGPEACQSKTSSIGLGKKTSQLSSLWYWTKRTSAPIKSSLREEKEAQYRTGRSQQENPHHIPLRKIKHKWNPSKEIHIETNKFITFHTAQPRQVSRNIGENPVAFLNVKKVTSLGRLASKRVILIAGRRGCNPR